MKCFASPKVTPTDFSHSGSVLRNMKEKGEPSGLPLYHRRLNTALDKYRLDLSLYYSESAFIEIRLMANVYIDVCSFTVHQL